MIELFSLTNSYVYDKHMCELKRQKRELNIAEATFAGNSYIYSGGLL